MPKNGSGQKRIAKCKEIEKQKQKPEEEEENVRNNEEKLVKNHNNSTDRAIQPLLLRILSFSFHLSLPNPDQPFPRRRTLIHLFCWMKLDFSICENGNFLDSTFISGRDVAFSIKYDKAASSSTIDHTAL